MCILSIIDKKYFYKFKKESWERLWSDIDVGYIDRGILDLLIRFNMDKNIYTKSSCSGRIVISDTTYPWSREETGVIFKKHDYITVDEVIDILNKPIVRNLWLNVSGPIIHLSVLNGKYARFILSIARNAGFKHSGILSVNRLKGFIIEIVSGVKMSHLLKTSSRIIVDESALPLLVQEANRVYSMGLTLLNKLKKLVFENLPKEVDEDVVRDVEIRGYSNV